MRMRGWLLILLLAAAFGMVSCGGNQAPVVSVTPAALQGNWYLFAPVGFVNFPPSSMTIETVGNQVYGQGTFSFACSGSSSFQSIGISPVTVRGQIAADGSFELKDDAKDPIQLVIDGHVPTSVTPTWAGSYTASDGTVTGCTIDAKGSFTATAYPALDGTYAGTLAGVAVPGGTAMPSITISTKITQEQPVTYSAGLLEYWTPLAATIQVQGSSCFTTGGTPTVTPPIPPGRLEGAEVLLSYKMNDGSTLSLSGWFLDESGKTLRVRSARVFNGDCAGSFGQGDLTLQ